MTTYEQNQRSMQKYRDKLNEYRASLTPEQKVLHAEEAHLEAAWKKTDNPKKRKGIKSAHSAIVNKLITLCPLDDRGDRIRQGPKRRGKVKRVKDEFFTEPAMEYKVHRLKKREEKKADEQLI